MNNKVLTREETHHLIQILKERFHHNIHRHIDLKWEDIQTKLESYPHKLWSLNEMEKTGGEPDILYYDFFTKEYIFYDCSKESPVGRRSLCYDNEALLSRKNNKPKDSALNMAQAMGVEILNEEEYRTLQSIEAFDTKTSSWILTPSKIRNLDGALFGDFRYDYIFIYHNSASSYYAARGFRTLLRI